VNQPRENGRVLVIGLDCAEPSLVFDRWRMELPHLNALMSAGWWGELESCIPCITVPAWACMTSGRDPGELGIYGFRNRPDRSYTEMVTADARAVREPRIWDLVSEQGRPVVVVGVPPSYPPPRVEGVLVSCFLAPEPPTGYTFPPELAAEIEGRVGRYRVDVRGFRERDPELVLRDAYDGAHRRFALMRHLLTTRSWDFAMMVEIGLDRVQHALWRFHDPLHPAYEPSARLGSALRDYYRFLDDEVGQLLEVVDDDVRVAVVSDHGARLMEGGICLNEWLIDEGYLVLREPPSERMPLGVGDIDWDRSQAWGAGGYYGRVFLNVEGREPRGLVAQDRYAATRSEIAERLRALPAPDGTALASSTFCPEEIYRESRGVPPDLLVYFGDLAWRSIGSVGSGNIYSDGNDTGPDGANHAQRGIFVSRDADGGGERPLGTVDIQQVAPTLLAWLGVPAPAALQPPVQELTG
jgi:predicted AlkP superfamily phosphohydrolase/phosphomutase